MAHEVVEAFMYHALIERCVHDPVFGDHHRDVADAKIRLRDPVGSLLGIREDEISRPKAAPADPTRPIEELRNRHARQTNPTTAVRPGHKARAVDMMGRLRKKRAPLVGLAEALQNLAYRIRLYAVISFLLREDLEKHLPILSRIRMQLKIDFIEQKRTSIIDGFVVVLLSLQGSSPRLSITSNPPRSQ